MWLRDLVSILGGKDPGWKPDEDFVDMVRESEVMFREVNVAFWADQITEELRVDTYKRDIRLNKSERRIRKMVLTHLVTVGAGSSDVPFCMVLFNVVKDAERIGDYTKNIAEIPEIAAATIPDGEIRSELREIGLAAEGLLAEAAPVFAQGANKRAEAMIRKGRSFAQRADAILPRIAESDFGSGATTTAVLMARFYKRIISHTVNIVSSVVMPVHKIDFFDEKELSTNPSEVPPT